MGTGMLNIWVSDVADPCGTWPGSGRATILDCNGVLHWPCGKFRSEDQEWQAVPRGHYRNLPFRCGHLEVELPPGCYWVVAGYVSPIRGFIHLNYTTHVGIVQVGCDETACVKLYNPTLRLCWNWFLTGLRVMAARGDGNVDEGAVRQLQEQVEERFLKGVEGFPAEREVAGVFEELTKLAAEGAEG